MPKLSDLAEKQIGKWTVLEIAPKRSTFSYWRCKCECGRIVDVICTALNNETSTQCKSCATKNQGNAKKFVTKHGKSESKAYEVWTNMKTRCYNTKIKRYKHYGGKGVTVCDRWRNSFEAFYEDMGDPPQDYQIDRINPFGNYEPTNCRWATREEQRINTRREYIKSNNPKPNI